MPAIISINLVGGFLIIPWLVALIWALAAQKRDIHKEGFTFVDIEKDETETKADIISELDVERWLSSKIALGEQFSQNSKLIRKDGNPGYGTSFLHTTYVYRIPMIDNETYFSYTELVDLAKRSKLKKQSFLIEMKQLQKKHAQRIKEVRERQVEKKKQHAEGIKHQKVLAEAEKIKERTTRREIREEAERLVFGKRDNKKRVSLSKDEREMIFDKYNRECAICKVGEGLHIHHRDEDPSNNAIDNLIVLCGLCHKKVHMKA